MHKKSACTLHQDFLEGNITAEEITKHYLQRIEQLDGQVGSFLKVLKDQALEQAKTLDVKRSKGLPLGKLAGIPIAIKDNIHIKGELTTCASKFLTNFKAPFNATVTDLLKAEDGIFIGKTNLDEFAMGSSTENSALKKTANPWNLNCVPGGSSGGSAAAIAARLCPIALGTDTGGSIRQPAAFCGTVGFKPTYGRVSRYGLVAFGSSLDQIGPLTTNTEDAALIMEVIGQNCHRDSTSINAPPEQIIETLNSDIKGKTIGVPWKFLDQLNLEMKEIFSDSLKKFKELGAQIIDVDLDILNTSVATYYILATAEASTNLARFDGIRYGVRSSVAKTLDEVYDLSKEDGFGQEVKRRILLGTFVLSSGYRDAYYKKGQKIRTLIIESYQKAFKKCDIIAMPTSPTPAFEFGAKKDPLEMYLGDIFTLSANLAGVPAINIPNGLTPNGMPTGLQLTGPQRSEVNVFQMAHAFEKIYPFYNNLPQGFE